MRKKKLFKTILILSVAVCLGFFSGKTGAQEQPAIPSTAGSGEFTCFIYFTNSDCPHCAKVSPVIHGDLLERYPNLVVLEYNLSQYQENGQLILKYDDIYGSGLSIPLVVFNKDNHFVGDAPILNNLDRLIIKFKGNKCALADGAMVSPENLDFTALPGRPNILHGKNFFLKPVGLSQPVEPPTEPQSKLTVFKILSLAMVDAVNPCALAVLTLMLIAILTYNPENKRKVLLAGLGFCLSVFIMYLVYGLVIIRLFQLAQVFNFIRFWLYKVLGALAVILGILNVKDFFKYKPGSLGTEMPMFLRPKVKKIISRVTSPAGALVVGIFVTLFLLPCTIGPYVICGGILCSLSLFKLLPWLLFYNLIFILPMLIITGIVYLGVIGVQSVAEWKDKNIKYLHLAAGAIILMLGFAMFFGLV